MALFGMTLERPFAVSLYYGGNIKYENGLIRGDQSTSTFTIVARHKMRYVELVDLIYAHVRVEKKNFKFKITLYYEYLGKSMISHIMSDASLDLMFFLAEKDEDFWAQIHVETEEIPQEKIMAPSNTGFVDLLHTLGRSMPMMRSSCGSAELNSSPNLISELPANRYIASPDCIVNSPIQSHNFDKGSPCTQSSTVAAIVPCPMPWDRFETHYGFGEQPNSQLSEDESDTFSNVGEDSDSDDVNENPVQHNGKSVYPYSERVMKFMNDIGGEGDDDIPDPKDKIRIDIWSEAKNQIRKGMRFESKSQLKKAITLWSVAQNKEFRVVESKINTWAAKCKIVKEEKAKDSSSGHCAPQCVWYVRAVHKKTHKQWQITRWVNAHNCPEVCRGNDNRNLTSTFIASHILHSIEADPAYPVKSVQADIKNYLKVDVSYKKAWYGKKKAKSHGRLGH